VNIRIKAQTRLSANRFSFDYKYFLSFYVLLTVRLCMGAFCPAGRISADISTSKRWKKLRFYDFALTSIVYKMA